MVFVEGKFQIAAVRDFYGIFKGLVQSGEQAAQLFLTFDVEFLGLEFHAVGVVHSFARLDAQQDVLHFGIFPAQIVGVVGHYQRQACLPGKALDTLIHRALLVNAVVLQFQEEISLSENGGQAQGVVFGRIVVLLHQILGDGTRKAGGQGDQALMVLRKQFQVHPGLAVKSMDKGLGHQIAQVFVALSVFAQQYQMIRVIVLAVDPVGHAPAGDIDLTADDGLDTRSLGGLVKIDAAVHHAVVGNGDGSLSQFLHPVHEAVDPAGSVQKAVFTM